VKLLHTSDWHVGRTLRGRSRAEEHRAALTGVVELARAEDVDVVVVVGDVFDTATPPPEAEELVYATLLDLADTGAEVVVLSGNHDNPRRLAAVAPVFSRTGRVHVHTGFAPAERGGVRTLTTRQGERVRLALLPFLSQRHVVRAEQLMTADADAHALAYAERVQRLLANLTAGFTPDAVNVVVGHGTCAGGVVGGGERSAHTLEDYWIPTQAFPATAHYVALGHLHRAQRIPGACPIWYSGSLLQLDFGEGENVPGVVVVEASPGTPADVRTVPVAGGRPLRTVRGTLAQLEAMAGELGDAYLRVKVREPARVGLGDEVRALLPNAVDVEVDLGDRAGAGDRHRSEASERAGRTPHELFAAYLAARGEDDPRLARLFAELYEDAHAPG